LETDKILAFQCDYTNGAHPDILKHIVNTNSEYLDTYGTDIYTERAKEKIKIACSDEDAEVFFLTGGTQTNSIIISSMLKSFEGIISADSGHISVHEAGAIEYTGHKVLTVPGQNGKLSSDSLLSYLKAFYADESYPHMVFPGAVYISHPTETGTLYTKKELSEIYGICKKYKLPLYIDGARLGYGLMSKKTDMTLSDIASLCDVFYIGGTKVGALCGEAVVFTHKNAPEHFMTIVKQHGAMLAKGRLTGVQFDALFTDDLYFRISRHAIEMSDRLREILVSKNYKFAWETCSNQIFVIVSDKQLEVLKEKAGFDIWQKIDDKNLVIRFVTSWSTTEKDIENIREIL